MRKESKQMDTIQETIQSRLKRALKLPVDNIHSGGATIICPLDDEKKLIGWCYSNCLIYLGDVKTYNSYGDLVLHELICGHKESK